MRKYQIHTIESAPEKSKPSLQGLKQAFGLVPNLAATMAESPVLVNGFVGAFMNFGGSAFTGGEKQVLLLTNAVTNKCVWAVAFHSTAALKEGVNVEAVQAIRNGHLPKESRLAALSSLSKSLIEKKGHIGEAGAQKFYDEGFSTAELFEVIAGIAISTMANYAGNVANPALEAPFQAQEWKGN